MAGDQSERGINKKPVSVGKQEKLNDNPSLIEGFRFKLGKTVFEVVDGKIRVIDKEN